MKRLPEPLERVIHEYAALAPPSLPVRGSAKLWRNVHVHGWPTEIHYEFLWRGRGQIGVELHCGGKHGQAAAQAIVARLTAIRSQLPDAEWDPDFRPGAGRLSWLFPGGASPHQIAAAMLDLISVTRSAIDELLAAAA